MHRSNRKSNPGIASSGFRCRIHSTQHCCNFDGKPSIPFMLQSSLAVFYTCVVILLSNPLSHHIIFHPSPCPPPARPSNKSHKTQRTDETQPNHCPASKSNILILKIQRHIPHQMPQSINRVKCEWQRDRKLRCYFGEDWPCCESCC